MTASDLPTPPAFVALEAWAGAGRVVRAAESEVATWQLAGQHQVALVSCGVPLLDGVIDIVAFKAESGMYRLAGYGLDRYPPGSTYAVEQETGRVLELRTSGDARLVNSSITHWLCSLHLVGTWLANSTAIQQWDENDAMEEVALAEITGLIEQIARLDPPAHGDVGDHQTHFWPAVLDRWLY